MFLEDIIILENTRDFRHQSVARMLAKYYHAQAAVYSPLHFGLGANRHRLYMILLRKDTVKWLLPFDFATAIEKFFFKQNALRGSDFFRAPAHIVSNRMASYAMQRCMEARQLDGSPWEYKHIASPSARSKIQRYEEVAKERDVSSNRHCDGTPDLIADIKHYASMGMVSEHLPALTTDNQPYSLLKRLPQHDPSYNHRSGERVMGVSGWMADGVGSGWATCGGWWVGGWVSSGGVGVRAGVGERCSGGGCRFGLCEGVSCWRKSASKSWACHASQGTLLFRSLSHSRRPSVTSVATVSGL